MNANTISSLKAQLNAAMSAWGQIPRIANMRPSRKALRYAYRMHRMQERLDRADPALWVCLT